MCRDNAATQSLSKIVTFSLSIIFLAACATLRISPTEEKLVTPIQNTATTTPTIIWFPPTATYTIFPTRIISPTIEVRPQFNKLLFKDNFNDPIVWKLIQTENSSIALGKDEISLAVSQPGLYLFTLRNSPILSDFYLEITASPGICQDDDEYGLLIRVTPSLDFYRFSLTCNGQFHLDKYYQGHASSPMPKTYSGEVPPAAPSTSIIAVWAKGKEISFYINNIFQFSIQDPSISAGSIGLFIRSSGENALSVSFSNLSVYQVRSEP